MEFLVRRTQICHVTNIEHQYPIILSQQGIDRFTVIYGKQVTKGLTYSQAAREYGICIMHVAACAGTLDNRERGERREKP